MFPAAAVFGSVSSELDDLSISVGNGIQLELVFGDITKETTDAVVNSTNFINLNTAVCKAILSVAGPEVAAEVQSAKSREEVVFVTQPGQFPCQGLLHVSGLGDAGIVQQLMDSIVEYCEAYEWTSVALPAICAGAGGLSAGDVAGAMLRGLQEALTRESEGRDRVRVVLNTIDVFLAFKEEATQTFSPAVIQRVANGPAPPSLPVPGPAPLPPAITDLPTPPTSSSNQNSIFYFGFPQTDNSNAMTQMKGVYQGQISSQRFRKVELDEELYRRVMWCIRGPDGTWERLPKEANYQLENEEIEDGILDAQGTEWKVNLQNMEVTNILSTTKALKRLENLPDFIFPLYWDDMAPDETLKVVQLSPLCAEYQKVKQGFQLTCPKTVLKIERVQNIHLRRSYEAQRKHISDKNKLTGGANEKLLYHGTTQQNAKSIMSTGFDRRFSGQNATCYGQGSYFALNSSYSAHTLYSKPAADGTQLMFLARVLTGRHALGTRDMRVPPPLDPLNPDERFDSTVDNVTQPSMFVVFHDNQAYPDYLVSFR